MSLTALWPLSRHLGIRIEEDRSVETSWTLIWMRMEGIEWEMSTLNQSFSR